VDVELEKNSAKKTNYIFIGPTRPEFFVDYPPNGIIEVGYIPTFPGLNCPNSMETFLISKLMNDFSD